MLKEKRIFCIECREDTEYRIKRTSCQKVIRDKEYKFNIFEAVCERCGEPANVPGLMEYNAKEIDRQYREYEHIVAIEDIQNLMEVYNIGKAPVSLALGFGEITITRYLDGQVPSKEYSEIIRRALENPEFMSQKLQENRLKIGEVAYNKSQKAISELKPLFSLSEKMVSTISYIFQRAQEVTPLALQKILYYIEALYMINYGKELYDEECLAWEHGPVYREVYNVFKSFRFNPIDDTRFAIFRNRFKGLSKEEKEIIDLVLETFGVYSGKTLERITHKESTWKDVYAPFDFGRIISKESMKEYFTNVSKKYDLNDVNDINDYIREQLRNH